jgi:type II secretory pathway pseudopilin PulG
MARFPSKRRPGGFTLLEILISVSLLLLLTGLLFGSIIPALQRSGEFEGKNSRIRNFLLARERLVRELQHVQLNWETVPSDPGGEILLQYFRPEEKELSDGTRFGKFNLSEVVEFKRDVTWQLFLSDAGSLVIRDSSTSPGDLVWSLGPEAEVTCNPETDGSSVAFTFKLDTEARFSTKTSETINLVVVIH